MDNQREKDIQELCRQVLEESYPEVDFDRNTTRCCFCMATECGDDLDMKDLKHEQNCAYLIAKDLSTNY
jgi:hypothetical protein